MIGMLCSCAGHAALFGGFWLYSMQSLPGKPAPAHASQPLVVDLLASPRTDVAQPSPLAANRAMHPTSVAEIAIASESGAAAVSDPLRSVSHAVSVAGARPPGPKAEPEAGGAPSASSRAELSDYQRRLYEIVARHSRYPAEARRLRLSGVTQLAFRLDRLGHVLDSWVQSSSGLEVLDNAALEALAKAQPLPPIPPSLPSRMDFVIEIDSSVMQQAALLTGG